MSNSEKKKPQPPEDDPNVDAPEAAPAPPEEDTTTQPDGYASGV